MVVVLFWLYPSIEVRTCTLYIGPHEFTFLVQAPTTTVPNSWATADLWDQLFGSNNKEENHHHHLQEEAEEVDVDVVATRLEGTSGVIQNIHGVVSTTQMMEARQEFSKDYWRTVVRETRLPAGEVPRNIHIRASLGDEHLYFAQ